ncbi:MAG: hypothetical protein KGI29_03495 [Pseudomonadota bacterium]|nr:hypothetical protein [Pseudomonadota bacterium]MDE3037223.1 hypothetical protein [Pseudomonadota bacterium]
MIKIACLVIQYYDKDRLPGNTIFKDHLRPNGDLAVPLFFVTDYGDLCFRKTFYLAPHLIDWDGKQCLDRTETAPKLADLQSVLGIDMATTIGTATNKHIGKSDNAPWLDEFLVQITFPTPSMNMGDFQQRVSEYVINNKAASIASNMRLAQENGNQSSRNPQSEGTIVGQAIKKYAKELTGNQRKVFLQAMNIELSPKAAKFSSPKDKDQDHER